MSSQAGITILGITYADYEVEYVQQQSSENNIYGKVIS